MGESKHFKSWMGEGACHDMDPEIFFSFDPDVRDFALEVCNGTEYTPPCPVLTECRKHALTTREPYGVWGGMTEDDRARARRESRYRQRMMFEAEKRVREERARGDKIRAGNRTYVRAGVHGR